MVKKHLPSLLTFPSSPRATSSTNSPLMMTPSSLFKKKNKFKY